MFEEFSYQRKLRRLQRVKQSVLKHRDGLIAKAKQEKKPHEEIERIYVHASIDIDEVDEDIRQLANNHIRRQAQRYLVNVPEFSEDSGDWVQSKVYGLWHLTPETFDQVRKDIRAEEKANWEFWQSRIALAIGLLGACTGLLGALIGVLAYLKK
jgi:hypothetical protein